MSGFRQTDSGLVVPVAPPPRRQYGLMELQDEESREMCKTILHELSQVMGLIHGTGGCAGIRGLDDVPAARRQAYGAIHRHLGKLLLGDDNQGWEEYT